MYKRFVSIWFQHLTTDWFTRRDPFLKCIPFVLTAPSHGRMMVTAANASAQAKGIYTGMLLADARVIIPTIKVIKDKPELPGKLFFHLAEWCIRFTPFVSIDPLGGVILDVTGCSHLWGGDQPYLTEIVNRFKTIGYAVRIAMADTIGAAWAIARYGDEIFVVEKVGQVKALLLLPPEALRLDIDTIERLHKLGLSQIKDFLSIPDYSLRRRFGSRFIQRLNQALGNEEEIIQPIYPVASYQERLPCLEPIVSRTGIEMALQQLLEALCSRLQREAKGLRIAFFKCFRIDGKTIVTDIGTNSPSNNVLHLFKLFEIKLSSIEPGLGIELFTLEAKNVEDHSPAQKKMWKLTRGLENNELSELIDRLAVRIGAENIHRFLPDEHYWPERSIKKASSLKEQSTTEWKIGRPRPIKILSPPEHIEVTAPIPDYPPMLFRYKGKLHKIIKADGPERIEQEWWLQQGEHRDYYYVEDEEGKRYWVFRSGHYDAEKFCGWFIHGFFS